MEWDGILQHLGDYLLAYLIIFLSVAVEVTNYCCKGGAVAERRYREKISVKH